MKPNVHPSSTFILVVLIPLALWQTIGIQFGEALGFM